MTTDFRGKAVFYACVFFGETLLRLAHAFTRQASTGKIDPYSWWLA